MSSKALSNVAGQFSKFGQSFNSTKGKSSANTEACINIAQLNSQVMHQNQPNAPCLQAENAVFSIKPYKSGDITSSDSEDNGSSIYEPHSEYGSVPQIATTSERSIYNESDFLPSVGIVMCPNVDHTIQTNVNSLEIKDNVAKMSEDLLTISISSVTDHVTLPAGLLQNAVPVRTRSPTPEIRIEGTDEQSGVNLKFERKLKNLSLPISPMTQADATPKQIKTANSPLSKFAKGMQNLSINLDPRKMGSKTGVFSPSVVTSDENSPSELQRFTVNQEILEKMWDENKCQSKLIAL